MYTEEIVEFLIRQGINPLYFATILCLIFVYGYKAEFENWKETEPWRKGLAGSAVFAATILVIASILSLFGLMG